MHSDIDLELIGIIFYSNIPFGLTYLLYCFVSRLYLYGLFALVGEELFIELTASAKDGQVRFDCSEVCFVDTFMGLQREQKVTLYNDSHAVVKFVWCMYKTVMEDYEELER